MPPSRPNLDLDTLRTFSVAHDLGGLAQAAEQLGRTPSAISLQMKRLQEELGIQLLRKRGRGLALTEAGEIALTYARRILALQDEFLDTMQGTSLAGQIRIGCAQDFAGLLPRVLSRFTGIYPRMQIELFVEGNAALADSTENGRIDLAVLVGHEDRPFAQTIGHLDLVWIASSTFAPRQGLPLPLALLGPQCSFRKCTIERLEAANIPYRIAANSPSLDGLRAALLGGLGVTARTAFNLPGGLVSDVSLFNLPSLGRVPVTLHRNPRSEGISVEYIAATLTEALEAVLTVSSQDG